MISPNMSATNSEQMIESEETLTHLIKLLIADMKVANSVDYYAAPSEAVLWKWSLSVPCFVCTYPLTRRNV